MNCPDGHSICYEYSVDGGKTRRELKELFALYRERNQNPNQQIIKLHELLDWAIAQKLIDHEQAGKLRDGV